MEPQVPLDKNARRREKYAKIPIEIKKQSLQRRREKDALNHAARRLDLSSSSLDEPRAPKRQRQNEPISAPAPTTLKRHSPDEPVQEHPPVFLATSSSVSSPQGNVASLNVGGSEKKRKRKLKHIGLAHDVPGCSRTLSVVPNCCYCDAKRFKGEPKLFCCSGGEIYFPIVPMDERLRDLLVGASQQSVHFRKNIRTYNNNLAFTSLSAGYDRALTANSGGIYTFKVHGQVYHFLDPLKCEEGASPAGVQFYFYDTDLELQKRMEFGDKFQEGTMKLLMEILKDNPYCRFFKHLNQLEDLESKSIFLNADPCLDQRRYNIPVVSQVGGIFVESGTEGTENTVPVQVYGLNGKGYALKHYFGCYDPMQYPLIFPSGQSGWHLNVKRTRKRHLLPDELGGTTLVFECPETLLSSEAKVERDGRKNNEAVTSREYYCYKLQIREADDSMLLHVGRLLQQFVVDVYIKIETSRLKFHKERQANYRTEMAQGIVDGIHSGLVSGSALGRRVVLPSSFIGGPRDMRRRYLDAMAIVQKFGKPDLFLTMTCNPYWPEIQENLCFGEVANDRPDLLARVFKAKVEELKDDLTKKEIFGAVQSLIYAIEYQKRGLPHCHMLIILKPGCKPLGPEAYDRIVCAELPDPEKEPHLYSIVAKNMIHGPCGKINPKSPCMKNGKCKFGFPKEFRQSTCHAEDGYPLYRRRNDGRTVRVKNHDLGNNWVSSYNRYLCATYACHINVEICSNIQSIKYIHKYIFKGSDKVGFAMQSSSEDVNEIQQYQDARWVGPSEAAWRIFSFKLNHMNPAVYALQVHLPGQQFITFKKDADLETVIANEFLARTMLTGFFYMNTYNSAARALKLLYKEFPQHFVWSPKDRSWANRKSREVIGRMVAVSPREGERYYLRLLLCHIKGPKSYEDLRTINGVEYATFRDAAMALGLLSSDTYIEEALDEACGFHMPATLRSLFAILLVFCAPNNPEHLWTKYLPELCSDFLKRSVAKSDADHLLVQKKVLGIINGFLLEMGKDLTHYGLSADTDIESDDLTRDILIEKSIEVSPEELLLADHLNSDQRIAYDKILESVMTGTGKSFFLDGPGGTGKTYLYRALLAKLRSEGYVALPVASSGVAASVLPGGRTAHSRFKIPLDSVENQACVLSKQSGLARLIIEAKLILWDEETMAKRHSLEAVDMLLKDLMDSDSAFGGKVVLLGGDFRQTLPVIPGASREEMVQSSIIYSRLWPDIEKLELRQNMRAIDDPRFCSFLLRIGEGKETANDNEEIDLPAEIVIPYAGKEASLKMLISCVFSNLNEYAVNPMNMIGRCILAPTNAVVDQINGFLIDAFPGSPTVYISIDRTLNEKHQSDYEDFLNTLNPKGLPAHRLLLKPNCPIILIRNLNPAEGLCNGTRLICRELCHSTIKAEIAFGLHRGKEVFIPRIPLIFDEGTKGSIPFKRFQFPVRICFAMTINKSQGQTLDYVGLYLEQPVFSHGQLYVALSRAKTSKAVKVLLTPPTFDEARVDNKTKNIVFTEIFNAH